MDRKRKLEDSFNRCQFLSTGYTNIYTLYISQQIAKKLALNDQKIFSSYLLLKYCKCLLICKLLNYENVKKYYVFVKVVNLLTVSVNLQKINKMNIDIENRLTF